MLNRQASTAGEDFGDGLARACDRIRNFRQVERGVGFVENKRFHASR
jgi:hypothetical protein